MPRFSTIGSGTPAPTTSFFGAIPDRFNGLVPAHETTALGSTAQIDFQTAANNINQWTIFNRSFFGGANQPTVTLGGFTTAPDGNITAQKVIPDTVNGIHLLSACLNDNVFGPSDMRLAVFAKAAGYTRIVLAIGQCGSTAGSPVAGSRCSIRTVFDLANGVVAVPGTVVNFGIAGQWQWIADTILPFGNGWYLCMLDVNIINTTGSLPLTTQSLSYIYVDNGSGGAAESTTFAGDGTSGVYTWRSCQLPIGAWGMVGQRIFFDDFNNPALPNFDLTNSRAPGFDWYLDSIWPTGIAVVATNPSCLSVSNSILQITGSGVTVPNLVFSSATWDRGTSYIGKTYKMQPMLIECRIRWDRINFPSFPISATELWGTAMESLLLPVPSTQSIANGTYFEFDCSEYPPGVGQALDPASGFVTSNFIHGAVNVGVTIWLSGYNYPIGSIAAFGGTLYTSLINGNQGNQPDISPGSWRLYVAADGPAGAPSAANTNPMDWSTFHIISNLWIPSNITGVGHFMTFVDGVLSQPDTVIGTPGHTAYSSDQGMPTGVNSGAASFRELTIFDQLTFPLFVTGGKNYNTYYDWISLSR